MNLKEKVALVYARKQNLSARTSWRTMVLFLAFLIPVAVGKVAAAQDQPGADYALIARDNGLTAVLGLQIGDEDEAVRQFPCLFMA